MKATQTTLFLIALVIFVTQTYRHAYVRWLEPRTSILDKYQSTTENQIAAAKSLEELATLYDAAHKRVEEYEKTNPPKDDENRYARNEREPYKSEAKLEEAIKDWEEKSKELRELWLFWIAGLVALAFAAWQWLRGDRWIGLGLCIVAFSEMVYATCPSFRALASQSEFDRLLVQKFVLSLVSLALLISAWEMLKRTTVAPSK